MTDGQPEDLPAAEDDAALWRLLERAPQPKPVSPYFARRVLREVAALEQTEPAVAPPAPGWLARLWQSWHERHAPALARTGRGYGERRPSRRSSRSRRIARFDGR